MFAPSKSTCVLYNDNDLNLPFAWNFRTFINFVSSCWCLSLCPSHSKASFSSLTRLKWCAGRGRNEMKVLLHLGHALTKQCLVRYVPRSSNIPDNQYVISVWNNRFVILNNNETIKLEKNHWIWHFYFFWISNIAFIQNDLNNSIS